MVATLDWKIVAARIASTARGFVGIAAVVLAAAVASAGPRESIDLPPGWSIEDNDLVWISEAPLRMGGARYEFRSGDQLLGYPVQHGNALRLPLRSGAPLGDLSVWAGGRRLDAGAPERRVPALPRARAPRESKYAIATASTDPAAPGHYRIQRLQYRVPGLTIDGYAAAVEVLAEVMAPIDRAGPMPVVLFLHGRHSTCYRGGPRGEVSGDWPCPPGWRAIPSHTGYRYIARLLASRGYLTVSISANGINGQDGIFIDGGASARSQLVRHHLSLWQQWTSVGGDPWGSRFLGRVNLEEVVLVGHSRGGEGVERATIDTDVDDPWQVQGLVLIGPTAFERQVAAGVHTTVILPFCDGDVTTLEGQQYVDIGRDLTSDGALRTSVIAMGTNHNFYNTEWTPGLSRAPSWDDWFDPSDPQCGESQGERLRPVEQQAVGLAYTAALVDLAIADALAALPLLDGTPVRPRSIGHATAHVHAIGGDKRLLYAPGAGINAIPHALSARTCRGYFHAGPFDLRPGCTPDLFYELLPHWLPMSFAETAPAPRALMVDWRNAGGNLRIPLNRDLCGVAALDFRIAGEPAAPPVELAVRIHDASGGSGDLQPVTLDSFMGPSPLGKVLSRQLRASLAGANVDLRNVASIELIPLTTPGRFWLLDISAWRNGLAASDQIHLPRVSVGDLVVPEGDLGEVTVDVPVTIEGAVSRRATLWVQLTDYASLTDPTTGFALVLEPGMTSTSVPVTYRADDLFSPYPRTTQIVLQARRHAVTGDYDGTLHIQEDDPPPSLSVDAEEVTAAEGASLEWTFRLSEPLADTAFWSIQVVSSSGPFAELDSDDLPRWFLESYGIEPPIPAVPLSELGLFFSIEFAPGSREATVAIPIEQDGQSEPDEGLRLRLEGFDDPIVPVPIELTGVVPAH
jgi:hypothetical protein